MREDNFIYLLVALTIFLVVLPIADELQFIPDALFRSVAFICLLAVGVWSMRDRKATFRLGMALVIAGVIANILAAAFDYGAFYYLSLATMFAFLLLGIQSALRQVVFGTAMTANRLYGAVCIYLMLGVLWALMFGAVSELDPGAFSGALQPAKAEDWNVEWLYYSFITLTTLGYGDILPVSATARALAYSEAVIGVFYMAVLVAALVGSYASGGARKDGD